MFSVADGKVLMDRNPPEVLIIDVESDCPYLPGKAARMPLRLPIRPLEPKEFDGRLDQGDRRHGLALYQPTCPDCNACEPIRIEAQRFRPTKTQRRVLRKGNERLTTEIGPPLLSVDRVELYQKHQVGRGLFDDDDEVMTLPRYRSFIVDRCCDSFELRLFLSGKLVAVAITDQGQHCLSAHYTFYDPDHPTLSLGTYAILKQLELAQKYGMKYLYLGLFIAQNKHMQYKARFLPHERRIDGAWRLFDRIPVPETFSTL